MIIQTSIYSQQVKDTLPTIKKIEQSHTANAIKIFLNKENDVLQHQVIIKKYNTNNQTIWFYIFIFLIIGLALLRLAFPKYIQTLYIVIFRTSFKQKQLKEKLLHTARASLLFNVFFIIVAGIYIAIVLQNIHFTISYNIWLNSLICIITLTVIYLCKYFILTAVAWIFQIKETITAYLLAIFSINKLIGIMLLPINILLVFTQLEIHSIVIYISWGVLIILFLYRYLICYNIAKSTLHINRIHFFIYLCGLELVPLLITYKILSKVY